MITRFLSNQRLLAVSSIMSNSTNILRLLAESCARNVTLKPLFGSNMAASNKGKILFFIYILPHFLSTLTTSGTIQFINKNHRCKEVSRYILSIITATVFPAVRLIYAYLLALFLLFKYKQLSHIQCPSHCYHRRRYGGGEGHRHQGTVPSVPALNDIF